MCKSKHLIFKESCRACRSLRKEWYSYLTETGFKDIECGDLLSNEGEPTTYNSATVFEATQSYYQWAREKANVSEFKTVRDKLIWENHAEGLSGRQMAPIVGLGQSWISRKLKKIENYLKEQSAAISSMSQTTHCTLIV